MVVNILPATPTVSRALEYNQDKVDRGVADILATFNMKGSSPDDISETFARFECRNRRTTDVSFHMSIDPLEGQDHMTPEDIVQFACRIMEDIGYGKQPFVVYRHRDIDREHYHVVSVRTDANGRKIRDRQEHARCLRAVKMLQGTFDYRVGNLSKKERSRPAIVFDPKDGDVTGQLKAIFCTCLRYDFTSVEQFRLILRRCHVGLDLPSENTPEFVLQGLDAKLRPCTRKISERQARTAFYDGYQKRAMECVQRMAVMARERSRIVGCAKGPLKDATTELHFRNMMRRNGIDVSFDHDPESGKITGGNFVDHVTKCAFRLSELGDGLDLDKVLETSEKWPQDDQTRQSSQANIAGELLLGLLGGRGKSREHDQRDETDLEKQERLKRQKL